MKILHTVHAYAPAVGGSELVVQRLSEALAYRGHSVTVATSGARRLTETRNAVTIERFPLRGSAIAGIRGPTADYLELLQQPDWDVMMNYAAQSWATDLALPMLPRLDFPTVLAPCGYSGLQWKEFEN